METLLSSGMGRRQAFEEEVQRGVDNIVVHVDVGDLLPSKADWGGAGETTL